MPFDQERPGNDGPDGARDDAPPAPPAPPALSLEKPAPAPAPAAVSFAKPGISGGDDSGRAADDTGTDTGTDTDTDGGTDAARPAAQEAPAAPAPAPAPTTVEAAVPAPVTVPAPAAVPAAANPWAAPTGATPPGAPQPPGVPQAPAGPAAAANPWAPTGFHQPWGNGTAPPPQQGAPQYPGQYGMPGYPVYQQPSRAGYTNGLAIATLVVSFLCYLGIIAIGLGVAALVQIKRTGERGKGLAVSGIVIGAVWLLLLVLGIVGNTVYFHTDTRGGSSGSSGGLAPDSALRLNAGDCADLRFDTAVKKSDCSVPHNAEAFWSSVSTTTGGYPGARKLEEEAKQLCSQHLDQYVMDLWSIPDTTGMPASYPDRETWNEVGGRQIVCYLKSSKPTTGSLRKDRSNLTSDQVQFLEATNQLDRLWIDAPDEDLDVADDPEAFRAWARKLAAGADAQSSALGTAHWRGVDQATVSRLVQETAVASQHFRAAAVAQDSGTVEDELSTGYQHLGEEYVIDLRRALELTTQDEEPGKPSSGQVV
ncbi:DUF4190 domain-containing protein [Kitasatospora sp. NPDC004272]